FGWWWLTPFLLAVLFHAWSGSSGRERAWLGFWFGFGAFATGTYWLYISIHDVGGAPPVLAVGVMLALFALMAAYHALAGWLSARFTFVSPAWQLLGVFPAVWVLVEWLRGTLCGGFPWLSTGYGQIDGPLAAWAPVGGVHGVTWLTAVVAGALVVCATGTARGRLAGATSLLLIGLATLPLAGRVWTLPEGDPLRVSLVQGGIQQDRKWLEEEL